MFKFLFGLVLVGGGYFLSSEQRREWLIERLKQGSDVLVATLLRATSQFGSELTAEGWEEQWQWREQRLRDLKPPRKGVSA